MCGVQPGLTRLEEHHIYPKSIHPKRAYDLDNGVTLCVKCHRGVVHAETSWDLSNWKRFVVLFNYQARLKHNRDFNVRQQHRLDD